MTTESEEWERAARAGKRANRRKQMRVALVVATSLVAVAGVVAFVYWEQIGRRKGSGAPCSAHTECASGALCFESECTPSCQTEISCEPRRTCTEVPVQSVTEEGMRRGGGFRNLCVREEHAARYKANRDGFFGK